MEKLPLCLHIPSDFDGRGLRILRAEQVLAQVLSTMSSERLPPCHAGQRAQGAGSDVIDIRGLKVAAASTFEHSHPSWVKAF